jgi:acyl-CoA synthetase (AMP-forming)/AMP-acid ligase II
VARRRWSYAELLEASERAARALLGRFTLGDRVAVWANNIPEWVILELAAGLAGITIVTVNPPCGNRSSRTCWASRRPTAYS